MGRENFSVNYSDSALLMKITETQYVESLLNGKLYMKCVKFHRQNEEDDSGKGDSKEGYIASFKSGKMIIDGDEYPFEGNGKIFGNDFNPVYCCAEVIFEKDNNNIRRYEARIDNRMLTDFVSKSGIEYSSVVFIDRKKLLDRIENACRNLNIQWDRADVIYSDTPLQIILKDKISPAFIKKTELKYQREFRILLYIDIDVEGYYELNVGDLRDISRVFPAKALENPIELLIQS